MSNDTDDFLEHYGIRGMRWGRRSGGKSSGSKSGGIKSGISGPEVKPKMSRGKKVAIAAGVGAVVAVGVGVALSSLNKNSSTPISKLKNRPEVKKGEQATKQAQPKTTPQKPKAPSPYPMTPLIATPILDELLKKYNPSVSDLANAGSPRIRYDASRGQYV